MRAFFKVKVWEEVEIDDIVPEEYLTKLFSLGLIKEVSDLWTYVLEEHLQWTEYVETGETITLKENKGFSTIELMNDIMTIGMDNTVWENGNSTNKTFI